MGQHTQDLLQQQDASAQQSQQVPLLLNSTHAAERWDGKSKLQKLLEPLIDGFKNVINPIANIFYGAMPTFRGLNTEVSTDKTVEAEAVDEVQKPKEFLVPQPRFIAQRKNFVKMQIRPKKYAELKVDLDSLKRNKDFHDYIKTKKYKHNYPNTYYYPRVKYVLYNPNNFYTKPNNSRLLPYQRPPIATITPVIDLTTLSNITSEWKPMLIFDETVQNKTTLLPSYSNFSMKNTNGFIKRYFRKIPNLKRRKRIKRDVSYTNTEEQSRANKKRGFLSMFDFITDFLSSEPVYKMMYEADHLTKTTIKDTILPEKKPPFYYRAMYEVLIISLDVMEGLFGVQKDLNRYYFSENNKLIKKKKIARRKSKPKVSSEELQINDSKSNLEQNTNISRNITKLSKVKVGQKKIKLKNKNKKKIYIKETPKIRNSTETETTVTKKMDQTNISSSTL